MRARREACRRGAAGRGRLVIFHDAAALYVAVYEALVTAVQACAALAFMLAVCVVTLALQPPRRRDGTRRGAGAPEGASRGSGAAGPAERPPERRTARRVPTWAHSQPLTDHNIEEAA